MTSRRASVVLAFVVGVMGQAPDSNCNGADTTKWNGDSGHVQWQKDMTSCGTKCLGRASCVSSCMAGDGWSTGCAGCFGDLALHCKPLHDEVHGWSHPWLCDVLEER